MVTPSDLQSPLNELSTKLRQSVRLDHLLSLADHIAVIQHAKFSVPARKEGYAVDDNARALAFASRASNLWSDERLPQLQVKLMSFLLLMQEKDGTFHNLMDFSQRIIDDSSVGDHLGRVIWATGRAINSDLPNGIRASDWEWFENILSYDNARLSQALLVAYQSLRDQAYLEVAEKSLRFVDKVTTVNKTYVPIGNQGWYVKGGRRAFYDQQPIEAGAMAEAATLAYKITHSESYERC